MNSWQRSTGYFGHSRPEIREFIPQQRERVLEVGCGEARFSALLDGISELWGIEPDEDAAAVAATVMHRVLCGTLVKETGSLTGRMRNVCETHLPTPGGDHTDVQLTPVFHRDSAVFLRH